MGQTDPEKKKVGQAEDKAKMASHLLFRKTTGQMLLRREKEVGRCACAVETRLERPTRKGHFPLPTFPLLANLWFLFSSSRLAVFQKRELEEEREIPPSLRSSVRRHVLSTDARTLSRVEISRLGMGEPSAHI